MPNLRTTVDDNLATSFAALGYTQSFTLIDTKIAIGLVSVAIAGGLYLADKKYGFEATYSLTVASIVVYGLLNAVHWYLSNSLGYKNVKYIGHDDRGRKVTVKGWTESFNPLYHFIVSVDGRPPVEGSFEFMKVFDGLGYFKEEQLTQVLGKELEKVNKKGI